VCFKFVRGRFAHKHSLRYCERMKSIYCALCMSALVLAAHYSHAQSAAESVNHTHAPPVSGPIVDAQTVNPLRDAGVAQADRVAALSAIAKRDSISIAAATLAEIEACDACLARNDLASILSVQPEVDVKALAPTLMSKALCPINDSTTDAHNKTISRFVKAACIRAIFTLPERDRPADAAAWQPIHLHTTTVPGKMAWDPKEFTIAPNSIVAIEMVNPDSMQHNMLVCAPGSLSEIGVAADKLGEGAIGKQRQYVPDSVKVLEIMGLTAPNTTGCLWFIAPAKPGTYPLVCTYPGHWRMMNGKLKVQ